MARDFYALLGLPPSADEKSIKAAYKRLAHQYHPDKTSGDPAKTERFRLINEAYSTLSDVSRRSQYDARRRPRPASRKQPPSSTKRSSASQRAEGFSDKLGDFFRKKEAPSTQTPSDQRDSQRRQSAQPKHWISITISKSTLKRQCRAAHGS